MKTSTIVLFALLSLTSSAQWGFKPARRQLDLSFGLGGDSGSSSTGASTGSTSGSAATTSSDSAAASTSSAQPTKSDSSQNSQSTSQPPTTGTTQTTPSSVTQQSTSNSQPTTSSPSNSQSLSISSPTSSQTTTSGFRTTSVALHTYTSTVNGVLTTGVGTSSYIITPSSTSLASDSSTSNSGISTKTRSIIIGIVCGIAGAVILGSLILMARRIFAGRRNKVPENDGLVDYNGFNGGTGTREKDLQSTTGSAGTGTSPFQSTLESYHNPGQGRNVSSNF